MPIQVCGEPSAAAEVIPRECLPIMEQSGRPMPDTQHVKAFAIKHARQQAAILGQMRQAGLLQARTTFKHCSTMRFPGESVSQPLHPCCHHHINPKVKGTFIASHGDAKSLHLKVYICLCIMRCQREQTCVCRGRGVPFMWSTALERGICPACWPRASGLLSWFWWTATASASLPTGEHLP